MTREPFRCELDVSEHLFLLTTESIRLRSNEVKRYETLSNLIDDTISTASSLDDHSAKTISEHLVAIPTYGDIRIDLHTRETSADRFVEVKEWLCRKLDCNVDVGDVISVLLFHYVVGQRAAYILGRLGLNPVREDLILNASDQGDGGNVVPII